MPFKRELLIVLLLVGCVGCDQLTKDVAQQYLAYESPRSWFRDTVRLEYAENTGAFLSLCSGFPKDYESFSSKCFLHYGLSR